MSKERSTAGTPEEVLARADHVTRRYHDGLRDLEVLRGVSLDVHRGQSVAIVGASGSGKSTLLHLLGGLDQPTSGEIVIQGAKISELNRTQLALLRLRFSGFVFQSHHLLSEFDARENVMLPMLAARVPRRDAYRRAGELLDRLGLAERMTHRPAQLSGGEQQRVAIARALANNPLMLLADEPTGNLDAETGARVTDVLFEVAKDRALVLVTHDAELAARADRQVRLRDGVLVPWHASVPAAG